MLSSVKTERACQISRTKRTLERAYEIYESKGRVDGDDLDDWLQAERDLTSSV
jgi:hypothetical protein